MCAGKAGGKNRMKTAREIAEKARRGGQSPLAYMLKVMYDETADTERRDMMAIAACSYVIRSWPRFCGPARYRHAAPDRDQGRICPAERLYIDASGQIVEHEPLRIEAGDDDAGESADPGKARPDTIQ